MRGEEWTWKEIDFLRINYSKMTNAELARELGRTYGAVIIRAYRMGLKKKNGNNLIEWTPQKLKLLTDFFPIMFNDALAKWLGVSIRTLARKAKELGLKKREDFRELKKDAIRQKQSDALKKVECATRFKKGQKPNPAILTKRAEARKRNLAKKQAV